MRTYRGIRKADGSTVVTVESRVLEPRLDLRSHGPNGFEWGMGEGGAAQLALAILADHLGNDRRALAVYQPFKHQVIWRLPAEGWTLSSHEIADTVARIEAVLEIEELERRRKPRHEEP